jgi:hypothetical protein
VLSRVSRDRRVSKGGLAQAGGLVETGGLAQAGGLVETGGLARQED